MTNLAVIDIGGTTIKFAIWNGELRDIHHIKTPENLNDFFELIDLEVKKMKKEYLISGVAISSPGAVNKKNGIIEGISAIPYIHNFDIQTKLRELLNLPITIENDANCVALAELADGAGKSNKSVAVIVIGSGIGGTLVIDRKIWHGAHLFGGEFGYMLLNERETLSKLGSPVELGKWYSNKTSKEHTGKEIFELAQQNDRVAKQGVNRMLYALSTAIYNIQYSFDPEKIIIGGSISANNKLLSMVRKKFKEIQEITGVTSIAPIIEICKYKGDANLRGAVEDFQRIYGGK